MRIDHRRGHVAVTEQFLDRANIVAVFEKMRRERVAKGVTARVLRDVRRTQRAAHRALYDGFVEMMSSVLSGERVDVGTGSRKHPLPSDLTRCSKILSRQRVR